MEDSASYLAALFALPFCLDRFVPQIDLPAVR